MARRSDACSIPSPGTPGEGGGAAAGEGQPAPALTRDGCAATSLSRITGRGERDAFTLIEAMACLVIVALAMTLATVNLRAGRRDAGLEGAVVELQQQDRLMRDRSQRQLVPGELAFDLNDGGATRTEIGERSSRHVRLESLGESAKVRAVKIASGEADGNLFTIPCRAGRTPSYAVLVAAGEKQQWLVVSGLTGAIEKVDDERKVSDIFAKLAEGDDAR